MHENPFLLEQARVGAPIVARSGGLLHIKSLVQVVGKVHCFHVTHDLIAVALLAVLAKENNCRRSEDAKTLQQGLVGLVVCSDVGLQQHGICQCRLYFGIRKCVFLHFLAGHTPVRVEIEHGGLALAGSGCDFTIEIIDSLDALELNVLLFGDRNACTGKIQARKQLGEDYE